MPLHARFLAQQIQCIIHSALIVPAKLPVEVGLLPWRGNVRPPFPATAAPNPPCHHGQNTTTHSRYSFAPVGPPLRLRLPPNLSILVSCELLPSRSSNTHEGHNRPMRLSIFASASPCNESLAEPSMLYTSDISRIDGDKSSKPPAVNTISDLILIIHNRGHKSRTRT